MKKLIKVLSLVLVMVMIIAPVVSFAGMFDDVDADDSTQLVTVTNNVGSKVYGFLKAVAIIVAVCMVCYMAIQWFLATPSKKAELKGRMWSMLIGVVLLVGGVAILNVLQSVTEEIAETIQ